MARKEQRTKAEVRVEGLLDAGDWRQAREEASRLAAAGTEGERAFAGPILSRLGAGPSAKLAFAVGLAFLALVAAVGLHHR